jgi:GxxExxY protein
VKLESGLRPDMLVDRCVITELTSVEKMNTSYEVQLLTYLRLSNVRLQFLINFFVPLLENGSRRMVI